MASIDTTAEAPATSQSASLLPTALIFGAFLVVAIVFAASSHLYEALMAVHVLFVVLWLGGGAFLTIMGILAERSRDAAQLVQIARMAAFAGERIFAPAGLVVVVMGISMVLDGHLGFGHFWIIFGLLGFLSTFLTGIAVLAPRSKALAALMTQQGPEHPETQEAISKILLIARADIALLLLVVVDMVTKPFS